MNSFVFAALMLGSSLALAVPGSNLPCAPKAAAIAKKMLQLNAPNAQTTVAVQSIDAYTGDKDLWAVNVNSTFGDGEKDIRVEFDSQQSCQLKSAKITEYSWQH